MHSANADHRIVNAVPLSQSVKQTFIHDQIARLMAPFTSSLNARSLCREADVSAQSGAIADWMGLGGRAVSPDCRLCCAVL